MDLAKEEKMDHIKIVEVNKISMIIVESLQKLLPQLTTNYTSFDRHDLKKIIDSESVNLFIVYDNESENQIIGTYTLVIFSLPTGSSARVEDVVVDERWRGKGIGKEMMIHAVEFAKSKNVVKIELTSHPSRIEANNLYQSLGFSKIETNVYRYKI